MWCGEHLGPGGVFTHLLGGTHTECSHSVHAGVHAVFTHIAGLRAAGVPRCAPHNTDRLLAGCNLHSHNVLYIGAESLAEMSKFQNVSDMSTFNRLAWDGCVAAA